MRLLLQSNFQWPMRLHKDLIALLVFLATLIVLYAFFR